MFVILWSGTLSPRRADSRQFALVRLDGKKLIAVEKKTDALGIEYSQAISDDDLYVFVLEAAVADLSKTCEEQKGLIERQKALIDDLEEPDSERGF